MTDYITKDGKNLRTGYTTGSCATAAAKAAAVMLITQENVDTVSLITPSGALLTLEVLDASYSESCASCAIKKDSGDDPDITNGCLVYARVEKQGTEITIDGGEGIGRVTKPGLDQPVGEAAINSTPRRMITEALSAVSKEYGYKSGFHVVISIPGGEELAKKTFNLRLGIEGGLSVLGTSGIVEPMSEKALIDTIKAELSVRYAQGNRYVLLVPGNYGADFAKETYGIDDPIPVMTSNFIGDSLELAGEFAFSGVLFIGHIAKAVKCACGMLNTHSKYGDPRMDIMCAEAAKCGVSAKAIRDISQSVTLDEALRILYAEGKAEAVLSSVLDRIYSHLKRKLPDTELGIISFSKVYGELIKTDNADKLLSMIKEGK